MDREWIKGEEGRNLKFTREGLLNDACNRWGLNKAHSVGTTSELIRKCSPRTFIEWESYYFENAIQHKKNGIRITREYIVDLGRKLYVKLSEVVQSELESVTQEECIDYMYNLVLNRTYEGYRTEIKTIYGQLEATLGYPIKAAPDEWDRLYNVDFYIEINGKYIGLQVKPAGYPFIAEIISELKQQEASHKRFTAKFGGKVFYVISVSKGKTKIIHNKDVLEEILKEIARLKKR